MFAALDGRQPLQSGLSDLGYLGVWVSGGLDNSTLLISILFLLGQSALFESNLSLVLSLLHERAAVDFGAGTARCGHAFSEISRYSKDDQEFKEYQELGSHPVCGKAAICIV